MSVDEYRAVVSTAGAAEHARLHAHEPPQIAVPTVAPPLGPCTGAAAGLGVVLEHMSAGFDKRAREAFLMLQRRAPTAMAAHYRSAMSVTSRLVKLDERELGRCTRSAARQGCCALGRGAAWHFTWADTSQVDNKRAPCEHPRYSHGPAAAWEPLANPWGSLQPVPSDACPASGRAQGAPRASYQLQHA